VGQYPGIVKTTLDDDRSSPTTFSQYRLNFRRRLISLPTLLRIWATVLKPVQSPAKLWIPVQ
jgi:hypothetical protein